MNPVLTVLLCIACAVLGAWWGLRRRGRDVRGGSAQGRDPLTGLLDHHSFLSRASHTLRTQAAAQHHVALLDIGGFKRLNRRYGHDTGDLLLMQIATRLRRSLPAETLIARLSGDEFAVMLPARDPVRMRQILRRALAILRAPYDTDADVITLQPRLGLARYPQDGGDIETLLHRADQALGTARSQGGTRIVRFDTRRGPEDDLRQRIEVELQAALLRDDQLSMHYQPICDCVTREVRSHEALMRWHHPQLGEVPPSLFVPIAERIGLIGELGNRALRLATADAAAWPRPWTVSVNLSPRQFYDPQLVARIGAALADSGLPASRLLLEITEGVLVRDMRHARRILREIQRLGVRLALDDFGTGYSGLSYLYQLPFSTVKIDRSFVRDLERNERARAMVAGMIALCRRLDLVTLAEGVESERQRLILAGMGCALVQGYLTGEPQAAAELVAAPSPAHPA